MNNLQFYRRKTRRLPPNFKLTMMPWRHRLRRRLSVNSIASAQPVSLLSNGESPGLRANSLIYAPRSKTSLVHSHSCCKRSERSSESPGEAASTWTTSLFQNARTPNARDAVRMVTSTGSAKIRVAMPVALMVMEAAVAAILAEVDSPLATEKMNSLYSMKSCLHNPCCSQSISSHE
jgi:hypothetical protein